jgi:hypothetical protein
MRDTTIDRRAGLAVTLVAATAIVVLAIVANPGTPTSEDGRRGVGGDRTEYGNTVDVDIVLTRATACVCPMPGASGEAALAEVTRAWVKDDDFGFVFSNGMTLSYEASSATPDEFIKRIEESLASPDESGPIGTLVPLRGTEAWVKELDAHGPAFVEWVEGGKELTLIGGEKQELSALLNLAAELQTAKASQ